MESEVTLRFSTVLWVVAPTAVVQGSAVFPGLYASWNEFPAFMLFLFSGFTTRTSYLQIALLILIHGSKRYLYYKSLVTFSELLVS